MDGGFHMNSREKAEAFSDAIKDNFKNEDFLSKEFVLEILRQIVEADELDKKINELIDGF